MTITKLTVEVANHQLQDMEPNDVGGLTGPELQELFDKAAVDTKTYINDILTEELDDILGTPSSIVAKVISHETQLADIATSVKSFGAKGDGIDDDTISIRNALNSNNTIIYFPTGTYKITDNIIINSGTVKKILGNNDTVFKITLLTSSILFHFYRNVEIEKIDFDFDNGLVSSALLYEESLGNISLKKLKFKNIKDINSTTSTTVVNIATFENILKIDDIEFENVLKKGNGTIGDAGGNVTGIFLNDIVTIAPSRGYIKNVKVIEMHNINASDDIIFEDTSGIYLASAYTGADEYITLENIYGYNFGKRLIKLDTSNVIIRDVFAYSNTNDALSAIGANNGLGSPKNLIISNVEIFGLISYAIATSMNNTTISNSIIDVQKPIMTGNTPNALGVAINADQVTISNSTITAERCIFFNSLTKVIEDLKIINSTLTVPSWGTHCIHVAQGFGFKNLVLENITAFNYSEGASTRSLLETTSLTGLNSNSKGIGLNITNCNFYGIKELDYALNLQYIEDINIINFNHSNDGIVKAYRGIALNYCKNIKIINFICKALNYTSILITHCDNVRINGLDSKNSDNSLSITDCTNVRLKDIDKTKILLNDVLSLANTLIESDSSFGLTAYRPLVTHIGSQHFDTTLNKPIWCKTSGVYEKETLTIDTGATVSGNITVTLNGVAIIIPVIAGDSAIVVAGKIRNSTITHWNVGGTPLTNIVTFIKTIVSTNTTPTFVDTGTTGTTATFAVTTVGTNPVWVDSAGTVV